jgi:uncharacterized membrane protein
MTAQIKTNNMKTLKILFFLIATSLLLGLPKAQARDVSQITDWYIKNFDSAITVNKDSSLDITEKISADCGNLPDKHGIFRVLPTRYSPTSGQYVNTPVNLISITDFNGQSIPFQTTNSNSDHTVTWKIGDPNKTVTGVNNYEIKYHVKNAIRFGNKDFDELYWNLNGNFWQIETDAFQAVITFPQEISKGTYKEVNIYAGAEGQNDASISAGNWINDSQVGVHSNRTLKVGEGITVSVTFPKNIITPYVPTFMEKYGGLLDFLIPFLVLILCFILWRRYGQDPKINPTIVPEFEIPEKLAPMEMGVVFSDGILRSDYISAALIKLAVDKVIKIEEISKGKVFKSKDYKLTYLGVGKNTTETEKLLLNKVFEDQTEIELSSLKNNFYTDIPIIQKAVKTPLVEQGILIASSQMARYIFLGIGVVFFVLASLSYAESLFLTGALALSAVIFIIFSFLMTRRSLDGLKLYKRIEGFKLYMNTAEKYRERFNEKEGIFEKFLPYAIMFGMTKLWVNKMKDIYGENYFDSYHPYWFYGVGITSFNADNLSSAISSVSSSMSSTLASNPSSSGSGGGGFSGGGGGGGGGGGW